uniref:SufE-like protein slr1419 n=2 Tax=Cajanus cajan TaxID=3821 RepID=A0A151U8V1_CAJCA|nr:putative sufE-like protein slr1419 [Cajanus cajan]
MGSTTVLSLPLGKPNARVAPKLTVSKVADKLNNLTSEFRSLSEPIERVKRLLHYASLLPPMGAAERVPENRVAGCATEVWVVAEVDERRRMRFRADSDSEISKGFCWCLVWMLDGALPEDLLLLHTDHFQHINVGLGITLKAQSRTNTWHNVFFHMQNATRDFIIN